jgi:hypothetical protein
LVATLVVQAAAVSAAPPAASFGETEEVAPAPAAPEAPPPETPEAPPPAPVAAPPPRTAAVDEPVDPAGTPNAAASSSASDEPDAPPEAAQAPPAAPLDPAIARKLGGSAHADRIVLLPTAYTHPKGTFYVSDYDVVVLQTGYAFTDSTQLTATFTPPIEEELVVPLDLSLKVSSDDGSRVRVAGIGSVTGILGLDDGPALIGRVGGVTQFCFDDACRSSVNAGANALLVGTVVLFAGTGAEVRVFNWLSLLVEADMAMPLGVEPAEMKGVILGGGARFPFRNWALDLSVMGSASAFDGSGNPPLPLLVYTYRWLPSEYRYSGTHLR